MIGIVESDRGPLRVWEDPFPGVEYILGVDVAEGRTTTDGRLSNSQTDWSAVAVIREDNGALVAGYRERLPSNDFSVEVALMGEWFNFGLVAVETNGVGISVVNFLNESGYPNLYTPPDRISHTHSLRDFASYKRIGWVTTRTTRPILIDAIRVALQADYDIPWETLLREMAGMERDPKTGTPRAPHGTHDDTVFAYGIAQAIRNERINLRPARLRASDVPESAIWKAINQTIRPSVEEEM